MNPLPPLKTRQLLLEIVIILLFGLYASRAYINFDPNLTLDGREAQWLTSSASWAAKGVREYGYIPFWQPYTVRGEPAINHPFSFIMNPINTLPSILFNYPNGIKVSVVLSFLLAGTGAWFIGRMLGFSAPARVLLGCLFIVKGTMAQMIGEGYFQLGVTQAYLPWVVGAAIAIGQQPTRRWAIILLAISITFLFWGGNIYFTLPAVIMTLLILMVYTVRSRRPDDIVNHRFSVVIDQKVWKSILVGLVLAGLLAAITLLPIFAHQSSIGGHPNEKGSGTYANPSLIMGQLVTNERLITTGVNQENYYVFTLPFWFAVLVFIVLPLVERFFLTPEDQPQQKLGTHWRIWVVGAICIGFFLLWGTGTNTLIGWAYANLPLIGQWRFVGRLLTIVTFWLAIFTFLRLDYIWKLTTPLEHWQRWLRDENNVRVQALARGAVGIAVFWFAAIAIWEVTTTRFDFGALNRPDAMIVGCLNWLRQAHPDEHLTVYMRDYHTHSPFLQNNIRLSNLTADFDIVGASPTIYPFDLTKTAPFYLLPNVPAEREGWTNAGYVPLEGSPLMEGTIPCIWTNPNTLPYAFTMPLSTLTALGTTKPADLRFPFEASLATPIDNLQSNPGVISLNYINGSEEEQVIVIQETAMPGWTVSINGKSAKLESVGQLLGVVIPPGSGVQAIVFTYVPTLLFIGGGITLITAVWSILYLLRADRLWQWIRSRQTTSAPTGEPEIIPQPEYQAEATSEPQGV